MKRLVKSIAFVAILGIVTVLNPVHAKTPAEKTFQDREKKRKDDLKAFNVLLRPFEGREKVKMYVMKSAGERLSVRLIAPDGTPLLSFLTEKKAELVYRNFNFSDAEEGVYKLSVSNGTQTVVREIIFKRAKTVVEPVLVIK